MRYVALSFDLDGTLVDTAAEIAAAANRTFADFGLPPRPIEQVTRSIGGGARPLMLKLLAQEPRAARLPVHAVLESFERHYAMTAGSSAAAYAGCHRSLERLREAGVHLACITNKELRFAHRVLHAAGLDAFFELVIGGDSLPHHKPHRSVIDHALTRLGCGRDTAAHVGDSHIDIATARNAGVAAWGLSGGYNAGEPIEAARPDRIFRELCEVADHVLGTDRQRER